MILLIYKNVVKDSVSHWQIGQQSLPASPDSHYGQICFKLRACHERSRGNCQEHCCSRENATLYRVSHHSSFLLIKFHIQAGEILAGFFEELLRTGCTLYAGGPDQERNCSERLQTVLELSSVLQGSGHARKIPTNEH